MVLICSEEIPHGVSLPWVRRWWPWHPPLTPKFDLEKPPIIKQLQSHHMLILWGVLVVAWWGWSFCLVLESHACCWSFLDQICFGSHLHYCRAKGGLPPLSGLFCSLIPFDHREIPVKAPRHGDWWKGFMSLVFPIIGSMGERPDWAALVGRRSSVWVWRALGLRAGILPLVTGADRTTSHPVSVGLPFQRWGGRDFRGPCWFLTTALFLFIAVLFHYS